MTFLRAIGAEWMRVLTLTFGRGEGKERGVGSLPTWFSDPHLRSGFFLAIPVFFAGFVFGRMLASPVPGIVSAALSGVVWLGAAAMLRARSERRE